MKFVTMVLMSTALWFASLAYSDIPPRPESLRKYVVELNGDVSSVLVASTNFRTTNLLEVSKDQDSFGPCSIQEFTWTADDGRSLVCKSKSSCYYKAKPSCTLSFVGLHGLSPENIMKLSVSPIGSK